MIGKNVKFSYLADSDSFKLSFKSYKDLIKNLYAKNFEDFKEISMSEVYTTKENYEELDNEIQSLSNLSIG